ncbi:MAG TPA: hypothetical protein VKZ53_16830 [Candidatus Angelobacter sp.]|nr:hypothetical protein [Candidatus Angelobacter sp.]
MPDHLRIKTVGTRACEEEYRALEELAQAQDETLSGWTRKVLLAQLNPTVASPAEETVLAEVLAMRRLLFNVVYALARKDPITGDKMQELIEHADEEKFREAIERLKERAGKRLA